MKIAIYETYDYRSKSLYWWTGRDAKTNCFEIRQSGDKYKLLVNESFHSEYLDFGVAIKKLQSLYNNGGKKKEFYLLRR
jgi:hypothetical protein